MLLTLAKYTNQHTNIARCTSIPPQISHLNGNGDKIELEILTLSKALQSCLLLVHKAGRQLADSFTYLNPGAGNFKPPIIV